MKIKALITLIALPLVLCQLTGCIFLVVASAGAVGGYAITRDTIQGDYDASYPDAWKESLSVCGILGKVSIKDSGKGTIEADVDRAKVKVELTQLTPESIRLKVKARKGIFPRLGTAEKVFVKIVQQLM